MKIMCLNNVQPVANQKNLKRKNPNFKQTAILDIGASFVGGSLKGRVFTDAGKEIYTYSGHLSERTSGFINSHDFVENLQQRIIDMYKATQEMSSSLFASKDDKKKLSGIALFVPGITHRQDAISYLPNLKDKDGKPLANIDLSELIRQLRENLTDIPVAKSFKFVATKDLGGTGLAVAEILKHRKKLKEGYHIAPILTGGGFGAVDIQIWDDYLNIITNEASNYIAPNHNFKIEMENAIRSSADKEEAIRSLNNNTVYSKIGRQGTGVKDYIKVYFDSLGHGELAPLAIKAGDARIVNYNQMVVKNNPELTKQLLLDGAGFFTLKHEKDGVSTFELNPSKINPQLMQEAKIKAAKAYARGLAEYSINKINDMANRIIITGPFANGIDEYIKANPDMFGAESLPALVTKTIDSIIEEDNLPTTKILKDSSEVGFKVICSPAYILKDNTSAGNILFRDGVKFAQNRGNWIHVPFNAI